MIMRGKETYLLTLRQIEIVSKHAGRLLYAKMPATNLNPISAQTLHQNPGNLIPKP